MPAQTHAAAHDDAVHEHEGRLGVAVDQMVEAVFFGEEVFQFRVARERRLMKEADVTARTEGAKWNAASWKTAHWNAARWKAADWAAATGACGVFADAPKGHGLHLPVPLPGQQAGAQSANHRQRQRVQRLGPVQSDKANRPANFGQHLLGKRIRSRSQRALCQWNTLSHFPVLQPNNPLVANAPMTSAPPTITEESGT